MRIVLQRSKNSKVTINNKVNGSIEKGLVLLVGFCEGDNSNIIDKMIDKIINLRIFEDEKELMNYSLLDQKGSILSISQFTLYADCKKGRRPSFTDALEYNKASLLYDLFNKKLIEKNIHVETGIFGEDMQVSIENDGPVTILLDSNEI
ncbi:MAG: D-aminoacyl-tRNA deacylase [Bacilli bacterium]